MSWNGSSENLFSADDKVNGYDVLLDLMLKRKPIEAKFGIPANADSDEVPSSGWTLPAASYSGNVLITNLELNAPDGDKATFSATFEGTGKLNPRVSGDGGIVDDPTA